MGGHIVQSCVFRGDAALCCLAVLPSLFPGGENELSKVNALLTY